MGFQVVARLNEEERAEMREVTAEVEAANMAVNDLTFEEAKRIALRDTDFAARIREKYEIEPDESMTLQVTTGHVLIGDG